MWKFMSGVVVVAVCMAPAHAGFAPLTGAQLASSFGHGAGAEATLALGKGRVDGAGGVAAGPVAALADGLSLASLFQPELASVVMRAPWLADPSLGAATRQAVGRFNRAVAQRAAAPGELAVVVPASGNALPRLHQAAAPVAAAPFKVLEPGALRLVCLALAAVMASQLRRSHR